MDKKILNEINRVRELISLKPIELINEQAQFLKRIGLDAIQAEISNFIKSEAKKLAIEEMKKGTVTNFRAGAQGAKNIQKETVEGVVKEIEKNANRTLTASEKLTIEQEIRMTMAEEIRLSINQSTKELADNATEEIAKQSPKTRAATWNAIKGHFGRNWKKYAALGVLALIFANFYPGEEPPKDEEDDTILPNPDPTPVIGDKCQTYTECFGTYTKCCKSEVIRKVQGCLGGLKPDGKFGPLTQSALDAAGYPNEFKDSDVDKICGVTPAPSPEPEEDIKFPEADDNIDSINN